LPGIAVTSISSLPGAMFCFKQPQHSRALQYLSSRIASASGLGTGLSPSFEGDVELTEFQMLLGPFGFPGWLWACFNNIWKPEEGVCNIW